MELNNLIDRITPGMICKSVCLSEKKDWLIISIVFRGDGDRKVSDVYHFSPPVNRAEINAIASSLIMCVGSRVIYWDTAKKDGASYAFDNNRYGRFGEREFVYDD